MDHSELEKLNDVLEKESELREKISDQSKELNKKARLASSILDRIHTTPISADCLKVPKLTESSQHVFESCKEIIASIVDLVPANQLYKYNGIWASALRSLVFSASLSAYLDNGSLISLEKLEEKFGVQAEWKDKFSITAEDYLHGIISLVNELSRLSVNSVTMGEFERPLQISTFVKDVFSGFTMLNLKNDSLRRRFDSLKYDLKKIEEVVYDVSLRKLTTQK